MSTGQLVNQPANAASHSHTPNSILYTLIAALCATWAATFVLLTSHDPLSRAVQLGADVAKEQALKAIPQDWMVAEHGVRPLPVRSRD
jgi:hypothetical protein